MVVSHLQRVRALGAGVGRGGAGLWVPGRGAGGGEVAGPVTTSSAGRFGLDADGLVAQGTGDNMAAALGLALHPGQVAMSLGTSGTAFTVSRTLAPDASGVPPGGGPASPRFCRAGPRDRKST